MEPLNTEEKIENTQQTLEESLENPSEVLKETVENVEKAGFDIAEAVTEAVKADTDETQGDVAVEETLETEENSKTAEKTKDAEKVEAVEEPKDAEKVEAVEETVNAEQAETEADKTTEETEESEKDGSEADEDAEEEADDEEDDDEDDEDSPEDLKKKKIKIIILAVFGVILLLAAVYIAVIIGGRNNNIPIDIDDVILEDTKEEEVPEAKAEPTAEVVVEDEEPTPDSMLSLLKGNRNYDNCLYADGGVVLVNKAGKFGAMDYDGKEIVKCSYEACYEYPTDEGYFVLSNSKVENKTEEKDGATLSYEKETTTYTLFNNTGKAVYTGNNAVIQTGNMYILGVEEDDITKSRVEYYLLEGNGKPVLTLYTTEPKNLNAFRDGNITVMGYNIPTSAEDEAGVRDIKCGSMDEKGKVTWFAIAPGVKEFSVEYAAWEEANKSITDKKDTKRKKKTDTENVEDESGETEELDEADASEESDEELDSQDTDTEDEEAVDGDEDTEEADEELAEADEVDDSISGGPQYVIKSILNSIHDGYFIYRDIYNTNSVLSFYNIKGEWFADLDPMKMKSDNAKGFVIGENDGKVELVPYMSEGEMVYNYGPMVVLGIGNKAVLVDISKAKGMTSDSMNNAVIMGVYDEIRMSDSEHWVIKKDGKYSYIDHNAQQVKLSYDDASDFYDGYALVVKDGVAKIINEEFEELEDIGAAQNVYITGDILHTIVDGKTMNYILKERIENPLGVENKDGKN